jgi:hypothetical protein
MKLSARLTTVSFLAASALGVGAFAFGGCTVTSGTVDDTDSGTSTGDSGTTTDSGKTDSGTSACPGASKQASALGTAACQTCMENKCCTALTACYGLAVDTDGGALDCNGIQKCAEDCVNDADPAACLDLCSAAAGTGVEGAYGAVVDCSDSACATECTPPDPDAGDGG